MATRRVKGSVSIAGARGCERVPGSSKPWVGQGLLSVSPQAWAAAAEGDSWGHPFLPRGVSAGPPQGLCLARVCLGFSQSTNNRETRGGPYEPPITKSRVGTPRTVEEPEGDWDPRPTLTEQGGGFRGAEAELCLKELGAERGHPCDERGLRGPRQAQQDEGRVLQQKPDRAARAGETGSARLGGPTCLQSQGVSGEAVVAAPVPGWAPPLARKPLPESGQQLLPPAADTSRPPAGRTVTTPSVCRMWVLGQRPRSLGAQVGPANRGWLHGC